MPTRAISKKKEARGIYPSAEVMPGRDWVAPEWCKSDHAPSLGELLGIVVQLQGSNGNNSVMTSSLQNIFFFFFYLESTIHTLMDVEFYRGGLLKLNGRAVVQSLSTELVMEARSG